MDYKNGKIYCISNGILYYIGSTTQELKARLRGHRSDYTQFCDGKNHYRSSFELIKAGVHQIDLIEDFPCDSKAELEAREYELINEYKKRYGDKCVNIFTGPQTQEEYAQKNRTRANAYYAENKELCNEKMRQDYWNNREKRLEAVKEYREKNKERINARMLEQVYC
jgi:hypothetical protein